MPYTSALSFRVAVPLAAALALALPAPRAQALDAAALAGYWRGEVGSERERVAVGLELVPDGKEGLSLRLDLPVSHFERLPIEGSARLEQDVLTHPQLRMSLRLDDGRLVGPLLGDGEQARLERGTRPAPAPAADPPATLPAPRWTTRLNGQVFASPVVVDGIAYVGTTGGTFNAVDTRDGRIAWATGLGYPVYGSAWVEGDAVYVASDGGWLHRLDRRDGRETWRHAIDDGRTKRVAPHPAVFDWDWQAPRPRLADGVVYVGGGNGVLHALDAASGDTRWTFDAGGRIRHGAAVEGGRLFVASEAGVVHALDRRDGRLLWRRELGGQNGAGLAVHGGRIYANDRNGYLHALDAGDGRVLWRLNFWTSWIDAAPLFADGVLYIGASDMRRVSAIDPASGRVLWRSEVGGQSWGTPLPLDDHRLVVGAAAAAPYFLEHEAGLAVLDRRDGRLLARAALPAGAGFQWGIAGDVARSGDTVVAADIDGRLLGYDLPR